MQKMAEKETKIKVCFIIEHDISSFPTTFVIIIVNCISNSKQRKLLTIWFLKSDPIFKQKEFALRAKLQVNLKIKESKGEVGEANTDQRKLEWLATLISHNVVFREKSSFSSLRDHFIKWVQQFKWFC